MAGLGRKVFAPGEVLTATNVQNYLMDQAVQVYASEAARGSAIGSATTEGMVSWLSDTNLMQVATGTATWQNFNLQSSSNFLINSGFDVWQRGTASITTNGAYAADRWIIGSSAGTNAVTRNTDVPTEAGVTYSIQFAGTSTTNPRIRQRIEAASAVSLAGQTVTLSFYAKSVSGSAAIKVDTAYPTTTADTFGTWASPTVTADQSALTVSPSGNASTSWTRYAVTFTVNALATRGYQIDLYRETSAASSTTLFAGVQLEIGSVATPFRRNADSVQGELAACQRYYVRLSADNGSGSYFAFGQAFSGTNISMYAMLPVNMRITPSALDFSTLSNFQLQQGALTPTGSFSINVNESSTKTVGIAVAVASGATGNQFYRLISANANAFIGFTAEL